MIESVSLANFQSWKKLDMQLGDITLIVGRGNTGKSAILRALRYALTNKGGDGFIRNGEEEAVVALAVDSHLITWAKRKGKGGVYTLDDRLFTKTGTTVPTEIADATGIRGIPVDKTTVVFPQLHAQFDQPFVIGGSGTQRARILGKLTKLDVLVQAQILARRERNHYADEAKALTEELARLDEAEQQLPDLDPLLEKFDEATHKIEEIRQADRDLRMAEAAVSTLREYAGQVASYDGLAEAIQAAEELYQSTEAGYRAAREHANAVGQLDDALAEEHHWTQTLDVVRAELEAVMQEAGICDTCPLRND